MLAALLPSNDGLGLGEGIEPRADALTAKSSEDIAKERLVA